MSNFDATEVVIWVQKTVGGTINRMSACSNSGVLSSDIPGYREKLYLQAIQFLTSDTPLDFEIKKECVLQCMQRLESAAQICAKHAEISALNKDRLYWSNIDTAQKLINNFSRENSLAEMFAKEADQILKSVEYVNSLTPAALSKKVENSRNKTASHLSSSKSPKA